MFCGRHTEKRDYRWTLTCSGSVSGYSALVPMGYGGTMVSYSTPDYLNLSGVIEMVTEGSFGATTTGSAILDGIFGSDSWTGPTPAPDLQLDVYGLRSYALASGLWENVWDSVEWRVDGSLQFSAGSGSAMSAIALSPASNPLGTYPQIGGGVVVPAIPPDTPQGGHGGATLSYSGTCTTVGSWEFDDGSGMELGGTASVDNEVTTTSNATTAVNYSKGQWRWAVPNWAKAFVRMESGTLALVFRTEFPESSLREINQSYDYTTMPPPPPPVVPYPAVTGTDTLTPVVPTYSQFLEILKDGTAVIEDPFGESFPAPYFEGETTETLTNPTGRVVDVVSEEFGPYTNAGECAPYLDHADWRPRFFNTWCHPHWAYGDWFPPVGAASSAKWELSGADVEPADYWYPVRQQHMMNPALPATADVGKRNFLISSSMDQNGLTGLVLNNALGTPSWFGTSTFEVDSFEGEPNSWLLDETTEDRWTFRGDGSIGGTGTGTIDASGITLDAPGTTIDFALGSYLTWPFMATRRSNGLNLPTITHPNTAKVEAFLVGVDGRHVKIGEITGAGSSFVIPRGSSTKHAGTWGEEAGYPWGTDTYDTAFDAANDISSAIASDPELSGGYPFITFGAGMFVRFVLTPVAPGDVFMAWPTFTAPPWDELSSYADASAFRTIIGEDAPAIRFGTGTHYDPIGGVLLDTPLPHNPHDRALELGDGKSWGNLWARGKGAFEDFDAEMALEYESGVEYTIREHFWRDPFEQARVTHSFVAQSDLGPVVCRVNSYRATPPLGYFPIRERTAASGWKATGDFKMYSYVLALAKRPHISTVTMTLEEPAATDHLSDEIAPTGWFVRSHELVVDGSEGYDWLFVADGKTWAEVRPWRGFLAVCDYLLIERLAFELTSRRDGAIFGAEIGSELAVSIGRADPLDPKDFTPMVDTGDTAVELSLAVSRSAGGHLWVSRVLDDGSADLRVTANKGLSWIAMFALPTGTIDVSNVDAPDGRIYVFTLEPDGATYKIVGRVFDPGLVQQGSEWDTGLDGFDEDTRISATAYPTGKSSFGIDLSYTGATPAVVTSSNMGKSFS